jgi:hypothetical protein
MDLRRSLASVAVAAALALAALLSPSAAWAASSAAPDSSASWPPYCIPLPALVPPLDDGMVFQTDDHSELTLDTSDLPDQNQAVYGQLTPTPVAAGSGWHQFQLTASVPLQSPDSDMSDSPRELKWAVFVSSGPGKGGPPGRVQYLDGRVWSDLGQWAGADTKLVTTAFAIDKQSQTATVSVWLRFKVDADASPGQAYVVEFGSYADSDEGCAHFTFDADEITVPASDAALVRALQYTGIGAAAIAAGIALLLAARRRRPSPATTAAGQGPDGWAGPVP